MKRREFIEKTGKAAALIAVAGDSAFIMGCDNADYRRATTPKPDFEVPADPNLPKVTLATNSDHVLALQAALDGIGGIERFIKPGERVLLKPNVAWDRVPAQAVNTNPLLVGEMVRQCMQAGAREVLVTDYGTYTPRQTFLRSGIREATENYGGRVLLLGDDDFLVTDMKGKFIRDWPVLKYIFEIDRLVNMPIAKHHGLVYGTASMKNFFGAIAGNRDLLHDPIDQSIVDLANFFRPTLTVIDVTRVLIRNGPSGGSFDDVEVHDSVICSTDQVAGDSRACEFLGLSGTDIKHVVLAAEQGLGEIDYQKAGYKVVL
jgi:uncharacterized protein (DUF362 family)